jgi:hypothetical protein
MKKLLKVLLYISIVLIAAAAFLFFFTWRSPEYYTESEGCEIKVQPMTMDEYGTVLETHARPFIININTGKGALYFYGSSHSKDPADPQMNDIRAKWDDFKPTVALVEGRLGFLLPGIMDPVEEHGEFGAVYELARADGVTTYTWEIPLEKDMEYNLKKFTPEQVSLFYILRPYFSNLRHGKPENPGGYIQEYIEKRGGNPLLGGAVRSVEDIDRIWKRDFAGLPDWRETSDAYGLPGYLKDIAAESNLSRNKYLSCAVIDLVKKGERVFIIGGSSHPVCVERTLRAELE